MNSSGKRWSDPPETIPLTPELRELLRAAVELTEAKATFQIEDAHLHLNAGALNWSRSPQGLEFAKGMKP